MLANQATKAGFSLNPRRKVWNADGVGDATTPAATATTQAAATPAATTSVTVMPCMSCMRRNGMIFLVGGIVGALAVVAVHYFEKKAA